MLIVFYGVPNFPKRSSFISKEGQHTTKSYGRDVKINQSIKHANKIKNAPITGKDHRVLSETVKTQQGTLEEGLRLPTGIIIGTIFNGINALINRSRTQVPIVSQTITNPLGSNKAKYHRTMCHIGYYPTKQLRNMLLTDGISYQEKILVDSSRDYTSAKKRKELMLTTGFNQKGIAFMMEDTFMTIDNYLRFFDNSKVIINKLKSQTEVKREFYGSVYKTKNQFKIANRLEYYNLVVKIHLVKILDFNTDVRDLIRKTTYDKLEPKVKKITKIKLTNEIINRIPEELKEKLINAGKNLIVNKLLDLTGISPETAIFLLALTESPSKDYPEVQEQKAHGSVYKSISRKNFYKDLPGKIIRKHQYSVPETRNSKNKFACSFNTALATKLTDSTKFKDRAKIVRTWHKILTPSSVWEFNLEHHLGKGIHLNYLYDIVDPIDGNDIETNLNAPSGYTFVIEYFGDRRATLARHEKDGGISTFQGHSPCKLHIEFKKELGYLYKFNDKNYEEVPATYVQKSGDKDNFEENSDFKDLFMPDRVEKMNINFEDIKLFNSSPSQKAEYELQYDSNVVGSPNTVILKIEDQFQKAGIDATNVTEDDARYSFNSSETSKPTDDTSEGIETDSEGDYTDLDDDDEDNSKRPLRDID